MLKRLVELEADVRYQEAPAGTEAEVGYTEGAVPILISAPHGAKHTRFYPEHGERQPKDEDEFTAGLARLVAERSGAHVLWLRRKSNEDGNHDAGCRYKQALKQRLHRHTIRYVLDFHGVRASRKFGIALGTANDTSCAPETQALMLEVLARCGFSEAGAGLRRVAVNDARFSASNPNTVTGYVASLGLEAAQFEFNAHLRIPRRREDASAMEPFESADPQSIERLVHALTRLVQTLAAREIL